MHNGEMLIQRGGAVSGVFKRYSRRGPWVLSGVDLDLRPGSRTLVVGGNGSGKSTLLRIVADVSTPTRGMVNRSSTIGYTPERLPDRIKLTGREYLAYMGRIRGLGADEVERRSQELFAKLDLQPDPDVMFDSLSKGNRQKLVIAQALLEPVGALVLDEPFSGLDTTAHRALISLVDEAQAAGAAVLISAHRVEPRHRADQVIRVQDGQLSEITAEQAAAQPRGSNRLVELVATTGGGTIDDIARLPGVVRAEADSLGVALSLLVERAMSDSVIGAVLQRGWSISSVNPVTDDGPQ
jgi:ABC-type multidrug transport system ATPase subunit